MQVQSNLGPAGVSAIATESVAVASNTGSPPAPVPSASADAPSSAERAVLSSPAASAGASSSGSSTAAASTRSASSSAQPSTPRARLAYNAKNSEVFVEVLDGRGKVLFTFPARESDQAHRAGLGQGSLVDQVA